MSHQTSITWLGHSAFEIQTQGLTIFIDPWLTGNPKAAKTVDQITSADLVLVTHDHGDHVGQTVEICKKTGAMLLANVETAAALVASGLPKAQVVNGIGINIGGTIDFKGLKITMIQAFHSSASGSPVGYILTLKNGQSLYHAGDTGIFSSMALWGELFNIQVAMLPMGGIFTMDSTQAALACKLLRCKKIIPMHWGTFPILELNTKRLQEELTRRSPHTELVSLVPGGKVDIE